MSKHLKQSSFKHINNYAMRSVNAVRSVAPNVTIMKSVANSRRQMLVKNAVRDVETFIESNGKKCRRTIHLTRLENFDSEIAKIFNQSKQYHETVNSLFTGDEDQHERRDAFNRIPIDRFEMLDDVPEGDSRLDLVNALIDEELKLRSGNRCNHSVRDLENGQVCSVYDHNPDHETNLPPIIYEALDRFSYAILFPSYYKELFFHKTKEVVARWNKCVRQVRTEGRVGMQRVLKVLLPRMDLKSLRVGIYNPSKEEFYGISRKEIAKQSGLTVPRVIKALRRLEKMGILNKPTKQKREHDKETDEWKGFPIIRTVKEKLFNVLGMADALEEERDPVAKQAKIERKAREKALEKERQQAEAKVNAEMKLHQNAVKEQPEESRGSLSNFDEVVYNNATPEYN